MKEFQFGSVTEIAETDQSLSNGWLMKKRMSFNTREIHKSF
jgi:hypothetical protein